MNDKWPTRKLRDVADIRMSNVDKKVYTTETSVRLCNYMDVYSNDYVTGAIEFMKASASKAEIDRFGVKQGDVIITKDSETPDDIGVPAVILEDIDNLICGYHLCLIRPKNGELDSIYLAKQLATATVVNYFAVNATGSTRFGLSIDVIENVRIPFAPKPEQTKIAEILLTVDRAIERTEKLIAKQQRIKTGLMQDLLTRGIDEHGSLRSEEVHEFKDSPIGRVPVEWDVVKVKSVATIVTGNRDTQDRDDSAEYPFFVRSQQVERIGTYSFDGEAVLTAGDGVGTGKVFHYINGKFDFHQRVYCLHSFDIGMDGYFFFHFFQANFMYRVAQFSAKGSVDSVRMAMIADMLVPKPTLAEQQDSAEILREAETILSEYARSAEKLKSLKTALMQDLLTGEVRVTPLLTEQEVSA